MTRCLVAFALAGLLVACEGGDKKPVAAPRERSQAVEAKPEAAAEATPVTTAAVSAAPKPRPPRALCAGQMSAPARSLAPKPISRSAAAGESELPEQLALGGGFTWVNFWAAWCAPCKEEIPRLLRFQTEVAKRSPGFKVQFISLDDDERQLTGFLSSQPASGLRRSYWLKEGKEREEWLKAAELDTDPDLPFHLLIDAQGKLRCVVKGALEDTDLVALEQLVGG